MEIIIRIGTVEDQDALRREDMLRLTPSQRIAALIEMRDQISPDQPLERVVSIRQLD